MFWGAGGGGGGGGVDSFAVEGDTLSGDSWDDCCDEADPPLLEGGSCCFC